MNMLSLQTQKVNRLFRFLVIRFKTCDRKVLGFKGKD